MSQIVNSNKYDHNDLYSFKNKSTYKSRDKGKCLYFVIKILLNNLKGKLRI